MQNPFSNVGTKFYICTELPSTYDAAGYNALAFTQMRGVASFDDLGGKYQLIPINQIGKLRYNEISGLEAQSLPLYLVNLTDAGQDLLKQAWYSKAAHSYKIIGVDGTVYYFTAKVSSRYKNPGDRDNVADIKTELQINSIILEI